MNIYSAIKEGSKILKKSNIKFPDLDCEILLAEVLKKKRKYLILNSNEQIKDINLKKFKNLINQRSSGKPIAYLIKKKNFWNSEFVIDDTPVNAKPSVKLKCSPIPKSGFSLARLIA